MTIGCSTACYYPLETEKTLEHIAKAGFKAFEVFVNAQSEYSDGYIKEFVKKCAYYDMTLFSFHPFTSFAEPIMFFSGYKRRQDEAIENYKYQFSCAKKMGAQVFNFHGDFLKNKTDINLSIEIYAVLREIAKAQGIIFAQENVSRCKSASVDFIHEMRRQLRDEVHFTFDVKQANRAGYSPIEMANAMGEKIVNVHMSDFDVQRDCLLPGAGSLNIGDIIKILKMYKYTNPFIIEVYSDNYTAQKEIETARKFLQEIVEHN